jgi:hypothetical protein
LNLFPQKKPLGLSDDDNAHFLLIIIFPILHLLLFFLYSLTSGFYVIETQQDFQRLRSDMQATLLPSSGYIYVLTSQGLHYCQQSDFGYCQYLQNSFKAEIFGSHNISLN